jgi:hypothetical protein
VLGRSAAWAADGVLVGELAGPAAAKSAIESK